MFQIMSLMEQAEPLLARVPGLPYFFQMLRLGYFLRKRDSFRFVRLFPPGHYHSPVPDFKETLVRLQMLSEQDVNRCPGIELQGDAQLKLLESFSRYYNDLPFPETASEATRYHYENEFFRYADAIILFSMLRHYEPSRVIEVGSGFSSAVMLDVSDMFLQSKVNFTFIEPQ